MVLYREKEAEHPPMSVILPRLYLGAQSDVTQERLASLGISYVVSVSRCSPELSFLPRSRCLRVPIDDSLWDDLLPWIPQALHFIEAAMSSGASVLVHCAAGISRSPALAVAYIMYSLGMDLDQAYRYVKERRPSISPNFNFLGQLQHFQRTLSQQQPDSHLPSTTDSQIMNQLADGDAAEEQGPQRDEPQQRPSHSQLSGRPDTFHLTLNQTQQQVHMPVRRVPHIPPGTGSRVNPPTKCSTEEMKEQGLLSPFSLTLNKLLVWGERLLLGGLFFPPVKMGQPALPYRC
ncbi:hypothetical protein PBY51_007293 [Eleginops maclovinus]|uniref:protein-tyrosine-phosphatase n=1 Tax=Eleginops maclovinus TaxID=56733 RepID=A0AAN7X3M9_ELEMC|nr:hypothetical protein PBY51_007293 [Eleginops maclovinus]